MCAAFWPGLKPHNDEFQWKLSRNFEFLRFFIVSLSCSELLQIALSCSEFLRVVPRCSEFLRVSLSCHILLATFGTKFLGLHHCGLILHLYKKVRQWIHFFKCRNITATPSCRMTFMWEIFRHGIHCFKGGFLTVLPSYFFPATFQMAVSRSADRIYWSIDGSCQIPVIQPLVIWLRTPILWPIISPR